MILSYVLRGIDRGASSFTGSWRDADPLTVLFAGEMALELLTKAAQLHPDNEELALEAFTQYMRSNDCKSAQLVGLASILARGCAHSPVTRTYRSARRCRSGSRTTGTSGGRSCRPFSRSGIFRTRKASFCSRSLSDNSRHAFRRRPLPCQPTQLDRSRLPPPTPQQTSSTSLHASSSCGHSTPRSRPTQLPPRPPPLRPLSSFRPSHPLTPRSRPQKPFSRISPPLNPTNGASRTSALTCGDEKRNLRMGQSRAASGRSCGSG